MLCLPPPVSVFYMVLLSTFTSFAAGRCSDQLACVRVQPSPRFMAAPLSLLFEGGLT